MIQNLFNRFARNMNSKCCKRGGHVPPFLLLFALTGFTQQPTAAYSVTPAPSDPTGPTGPSEIFSPEFLLKGSTAEWKRLLYYQMSILGRESGMIDTPGFYLAADGKNNPVAELVATYKAITTKNPRAPGQNAHAACVFPARLEFMKRNGLLRPEEIPDTRCPELEKWLAQRNYQSLWLVFSSWYPDNPASMFGHTFLRFQRADRQSDLLDDAVNFGAAVGDSDDPFYAIKGLMGGYFGRFSMMPYHLKINEYNNVESRDLWEYRISTNPEQIRRIALSLWEVGSHGVDYYYLDENCSWIMLKVLENGDPSWDFMPEIKFWVVPIDTVRWALMSPQLDIVRQSRISMQQRFRQRYALLGNDGRKQFQRLVAMAGSGNDASRIPISDVEMLRGVNGPIEQRRLADAMLDWVDYKDSSGLVKREGFSELRKRLLSVRSTLAGPPDVLQPLQPADDPALGHGTTHVRFGAVRQPDGGIYNALSWTPALHELMAAPPGYADGLEIVMFRMGAWWDHHTDSLIMNDFGLLRIRALNPWDPATKPVSWKVDLGFTTDGVCPSRARGCQKFSGSGGRGYARKFKLTDLLGEVTAALLIDAETGYIQRDELGGWFAGLGPSAELWYGSRQLRVEAAFSGQQAINDHGRDWQEWRQSIKVGASLSPTWDLRLSFEFRGLKNHHQTETGLQSTLMTGFYF